MNQNSPDSSPAQNLHHDSSKRKRRGWGLILLVVGAFFLLLLLSPVIAYLVWCSYGQAELQKEITAIKASNDPLTTAEMNAYHKVPVGARDITPIWVAAIRPFEDKAFIATTGTLPIVGDRKEVPPLAEPFSADDDKAIRDWLMLHKGKIAAIYAAAKEEGEVRYPRDFATGFNMQLPEAQQVRSAVRALSLEFQILARQSDLSPALENMHTRLIAGDTLRHEPILLSMLVRIAVHGVVLKDILALAATGKCSDTELATMQEWLRDARPHDQLDAAMLGERAGVYHAFHNMGLFAGPGQFPAQPKPSTDDGSGVSRAEDCAQSLRMLTRMREAAAMPLPEAFDASQQIDQEFKQLVRNGPVNNLRYMLTIILLPALGAVTHADARSDALAQLTDVALAVERYQLKHHALPGSFSDLTPDYLLTGPIDPYSGQPMIFLAKPDRVIVYSVGKDRQDNGGECDPQRWEPDIAVEILLRSK